MSENFDENFTNQLEFYLERRSQADKFSGAVLLAHDGKVLFKKAYGQASQRYNISNQVDTRFNLGSMNKMFTGTAIVQLAERGKLDFADRVGKHLPDFPHREIAEKVSIHHLLTHTGGLGSYFNNEFMLSAKERFRTIDDYLPLMLNEPLLFTPGEQWMYSNSGFLLLGKLIEQISGMSYYDFIRENIYQPAGMQNTDCYEMDDDGVQNLAMGYTKNFSPSGKRINNIFLHSYKGGPAGGGFSTVEDLFKFDQALRAHRLLSPEFTTLLLAGKVNVSDSDDCQYAYGFEDNHYNGVRVVGHGGGFPGINSKLDIYPELGYTVAVMSNYDPSAAEAIASYVRKLVTGTALVQPIQLDEQAIQPILGEYLAQGGSMPDLTLTITKEGDMLMARYPQGFGDFEIVALSADEFCDEETTDRRLFLQRDEHGQVTGFEWVSQRALMQFKKIS